MATPKIIIKQTLPSDNVPHPFNSPILISYDLDLGWIVEKVYEGEYEVQEFPPHEHCKNEEPNLELACNIANGREIWIYPK